MKSLDLTHWRVMSTGGAFDLVIGPAPGCHPEALATAAGGAARAARRALGVHVAVYRGDGRWWCRAPVQVFKARGTGAPLTLPASDPWR